MRRDVAGVFLRIRSDGWPISGEFYWKIEKLKDWKIKSAARNERGLKWFMDSGVQTVGSGRAESMHGT